MFSNDLNLTWLKLIIDQAKRLFLRLLALKVNILSKYFLFPFNSSQSPKNPKIFVDLRNLKQNHGKTLQS